MAEEVREAERAPPQKTNRAIGPVERLRYRASDLLLRHIVQCVELLSQITACLIHLADDQIELRELLAITLDGRLHAIVGRVEALFQIFHGLFETGARRAERPRAPLSPWYSSTYTNM